MLADLNNYMTGDEARAIRKYLGLSASGLSKIFGCNASHVYRQEWRKSEPVTKMHALALRYMLAHKTGPEK